MPHLYDLTVLAQDHEVFRGRVESLVAPAWDGYVGVLAQHAPMVAELSIGRLTVLEESGERRFLAVAGGYLEVGWNEVTILADASEAADEIDVTRAHAAEERARKRMQARDAETDLRRAEAALRRALNRLRVAEKRRRAPQRRT